MRKLLLSFVALGLCIAFSSMPAHAQTPVNLVFTGSQVTFTTISTGVSAQAAFSGTGLAFWSGGFGAFSITGSPVQLTYLSTAASTDYYSGSPAGLTLFVTDGAGSTLTGTAELLTFSQTDQTGTFNSAITMNLTGLTGTGTLAGYTGIPAGLQLVLDLPPGTGPIDNLSAPTDNQFGSGTVNPSPEPASMLLFGSGLLVLGGILRRRFQAA